MYLKELLKSVDLQSSSGNSLGPIANEKEQIVRSFIDALLDEDNCQAVFRGEKKVAAYRQSGATHYINVSSEELLAIHSDIIFYIGTKAKSYLYDLGGFDTPFDISSIDISIFKIIFNEIEYSISENLYTGTDEFNAYFNEINKIDFIDKIAQLENDEKQQIIIYYLWLLHVIGKTDYKRYSNFLSTTKNHLIAKDFGYDQLIYCGWIPRPIKDKSAYLGSLIQLEQRIRYLGLPLYNNEPYPDEHEISLLGGLFPHYTLGIYDSAHERLIVNKHLLDDAVLHLVSNGMSELVISLGIFIDQSQFESSEKLQNSRYKRWLSHSPAHGFSDHNVDRST